VKVFIDTGIFIAFFIRQESRHDDVTAKYQWYRKNKAIFVTSTYVLDELFTWFAYHQPSSITEKVVRALDRIEKERELRVIDVDEVTRKKASELFTKYLDQRISFTDVTTAILLKKFSFDELFTLDSDFRNIGIRNISSF